MRVAAVLLAAGCGGLPCAATVDDDVRTVVDVAFDARAGGLAEVTFDAGDGEVTTPPVEGDGRAYTIDLFGLPPLTDVSWRAVARWGSREATCEGVTRTGNLPAGLPDLTVTVDAPGQDGWRYLLGTTLGDPSALFVIDRLGTWRWYVQGDPALARSDVEFARDSHEVVYDEQSGADRSVDVGRIVRLAPDGAVRRDIATPLGHHVFAQGPHGDLAYLAIDVRPWTDPESGETVDVVGDDVIVVKNDGSLVPLWDVWDHLEPVRQANWDTGFYPQGEDWSHANGINWDPGRASYLVSLGNARVVFEIDDATGAVIRQLGGEGGYRFAEGTPRFFHQHDARLTDAGTLMVALTGAAGTGGSGVVEYAIDDERALLTEVWSYGLDGDLQAHALGQGIPLSNGNVLVSYGGTGVIREVTRDGVVVWELVSGSGSWFGNAWPFVDFYAPGAP